MEKRVKTESKRRKRGLAAACAVLGGVLVLSACNGDGDKAGRRRQLEVGAGAGRQGRREGHLGRQDHHLARRTAPNNVGINSDTKVTVADGKLTDVTLTSADGAKVAGKISADGLSWAPGQRAEALGHVQDHRDRGGRQGAPGARERLLHHRLPEEQLHRQLHARGRLHGRRRHAGVDQLRQGDHRTRRTSSPRSRSPPAAVRRSSGTGSARSASTSARRSTGRRTRPSP